MSKHTKVDVKAQLPEPVSALHAEARRLALSGTPIFPCLPGSKKPATKHGFHDATTEIAIIDGWWLETPDLNIAFSPHAIGLSVVDLDGPAAHDAWADAQIEHGFAPDTYAVATPRQGGQHLYFRGELPPTQGTATAGMAPHIDTRGRGSYALVPPSVIDARGESDPAKHGTYRVESNLAPADVPSWIAELIASKRRARVKASGVGLDEPGNVARAERLLRDYVERGSVAVAGEGGNTRTFAVACEVQNLGVSEEVAFKLLSTIYNPACLPPWAEDELEAIVSNAASYAQNEAGAWASGSSADVFGPTLGSLGLNQPQEARRSRFRLIFPAEMRTLPEPSYAVDQIVPEQGIVLIYGPTASLKTFLVLDLLASAAAGVPAFGRYRSRQGAGVLFAGEAPFAVARRRWPAFVEARGIAQPDDVPFAIVPAVPLVSDPGQMEAIIDRVKAAGVSPRIIAIDTVARAVGGLDENDAKSAGLIVAAAERLRDALSCAVILVHHTGKDESKGARGSSALTAGVDAVWRVQRPKRDGLAVSMKCEKMKDADEPADIQLTGKAVGQSLVFAAISADEYAAATRANPPLSPAEVGKALQATGAVEGVEVNTDMLAATLCPGGDIKAVKNMARRLRGAASGVLAAYVTEPAGGRGTSIKWSFPVLSIQGAAGPG